MVVRLNHNTFPGSPIVTLTMYPATSLMFRRISPHNPTHSHPPLPVKSTRHQGLESIALGWSMVQFEWRSQHLVVCFLRLRPGKVLKFHWQFWSVSGVTTGFSLPNPYPLSSRGRFFNASTGRNDIMSSIVQHNGPRHCRPPLNDLASCVPAGLCLCVQIGPTGNRATI